MDPLTPSQTHTAPDARPAAPKPFWARNEHALIGAVSMLAFLAFWEAAVALEWVNPLFTSSPSRIGRAGYEMFADGSIYPHLAVSGYEFLVGYGMAIVIGVPLGILMGWYGRINAVLDPFVSALYATPRIALLPLLMIWFGIGLMSKIAIVFLGAIFPILVNTITGVRTLHADFVKVARSFGASDRQIFLTVALPSSVPLLLTGLRLGLGHALVGIVVGEMYGATHGLGFLIATSGARFQTDKLMVGILLIAATAAALVAAASSATAQDWPTRPLTMVVPFAAGASSDILGRILAPRIAEHLGKPVIVENVGGAGGMNGAARVAKAPPDGYQFLVGSTGTLAINQTLYKNPPYNAATDFAPVAFIADQPIVLLARNDLPVGNLAAFIGYVRANQAKLQFASSGAGTTPHLGCLMLHAAIGVNVTHIPYRGAALAIQDMIAGQTDYQCTVLSPALPQIEGKLVKPLALLSRNRSPSLPTLATAHEQGGSPNSTCRPGTP